MPPTNGILGVITVAPCAGSPDYRGNWLPEVGEVLCFNISVSNPMRLTAIFKTSTYEGEAMNAACSGSEQINDLDPHGSQSGWQLIDDRWEGVQRVFEYRSIGMVHPEAPRQLSFDVLDYGAEGDLYVFACQDAAVTCWPYPITAPHDYEMRFHSTVDADEDGFTEFEENRGFMVVGSHQRFDPDAKNFILINDYPCRDRIGEMLAGWVISETEPDGEADPNIGFTWIDTRNFMGSDGSSSNPLCVPDNFTPPQFYNGDWHQGVIPNSFRLDMIVLKEDTNGVCRCWDPCRGCGSTDSITVYQLTIEDFMNFLANPANGYSMPLEHWIDYRDEYINRTWVHELGHALGLDHVPDGDWNCAMRSGNTQSLPGPGQWWPNFHFYGTNLYYCGGTPGLRR